jgi:hypothetical protein
MHSRARRAAKALAGLAVAAGLALGAAPPGRAALTGEGPTVKPLKLASPSVSTAPARAGPSRPTPPPPRQRQCEQDQAGAADRLHHRR